MDFETLANTHSHTHTNVHPHYIGFNLAGVLLCWCLAPSMEVCLEMNLHVHIHTFTCKDTYIQAHSCGVSFCPAAVNSVFKRYSYISMLYIVHPVYIEFIIYLGISAVRAPSSVG